eukprot:COSAG02_NODE_50176_length_322_cov_0.699552_1_plen_57_part_01
MCVAATDDVFEAVFARLVQFFERAWLMSGCEYLFAPATGCPTDLVVVNRLISHGFPE